LALDRLTPPNPAVVIDAQAQAQIARLQAQAQRFDFEFEGRRVCWRRFGAGAPLVLIHGGHGSWLHWARNIEALAEQFTVWAPDLPGYGESDEAGPGGLADLLASTLSSLDALIGAEELIDLAGFSFGALVAAHIAARRGRVRRLVLLGPGGHGGPRRPQGELRNWRLASNEAALRACMHHNLAAHMLHDAANIDALALQVHTDACRRTRFRSKDISRAGGLGPALDQHAGGVLLVWGEHDVTAHPEALAPALTAGHPKRHAHIVPGAGHWVQYEAAEPINRLLLDYLKTG
jgi:pimeloyl-ACP methyl ester carboxylesterase